ncbi:prepilin-type N-terminal cleavage/methylation domain-containing protein [Dokdonella sp.]|uniref:prepilin-type N-terminal cleavage/methylation domain-containing protein n=1 Tax=Dokdonella sp. TaxID=2291710 RepID=UPI0025BBD549|nr:prepilin-type N-terminal cleavage/methylation domain-containing protein [Dokdonella sp.]MBX3690810.1 prepilin-type N-terminal cleavage/methylation domain-containing protein [Dokdonella sp.]
MDLRMPARPRGFTLIELMLAILLLAVMLALAYGGIRSAVKSMHTGEALIDRVNRMRVAQEFIRHQVSRTLPLPFGQDESTGVNFMFQGEGDFMRFVAPMPGYLSRGGSYVQTLELTNTRNGKHLLFFHSMLNGYDPKKLRSDDPDPVVLMDQIESGRFEYRKLDADGKLGDWSDDWEDPGFTPMMVRIRLKMRPEALVDWPDMEIPLVLDAGAAQQSMRAPQFGNMPVQSTAPPVHAAGGARRRE